MGSGSHASGTGERASASGRDSRDGSDIAPDQVIGPDGQSDAALQYSLVVSKLVALRVDEDYTDKT